MENWKTSLIGTLGGGRVVSNAFPAAFSQRNAKTNDGLDCLPCRRRVWLGGKGRKENAMTILNGSSLINDPRVADNDWNHLYPDFRQRLGSLFATCAAKGLLLQLAEGFRSQLRQARLYAQGRPGEPGYEPGPIVTDNRVSKWHGAGLAADCYPVHNGHLVYEFTDAELEIFRSCMKAFGLRPTTFKGDYGHVQRDCDAQARLEAVAWAHSGFAEPPAPKQPVAVIVNGVAVASAGGYLGADGHARAWIRLWRKRLRRKLSAWRSPTYPRPAFRSRGETSRCVCRSKCSAGGAFGLLAALGTLPGVAVAWDSKALRIVIKAN